MKTLIIDGNNLIWRTYWTANSQSKRDGIEDQDQINKFHIYFTINAIYSYIVKYAPTTTIVVWDEKIEFEKNTRKDLYEDYKGNRSGDKSPHQNNETIKEFLELMGINSMFPRELEADDIIAYLCRTVIGNIVIASVDRDFLQLVSPEVMVFDPIRKREYKFNTFKEDTGYDNTTDWLIAKCFLGDKSDNVPKVDGFGEAKIKKYLAGKVTLTDEELSVFNRNQTLFCLSQHSISDREAEYYKNQQRDVAPNWNGFLDKCKEFNFQSILKKKEAWYNNLFFKSKLLTLFSK